MKSAADDKIWTLIANMATRITGKILDPKDTLEILQLVAGKRSCPKSAVLCAKAGVLGSTRQDSGPLNLREHNKVIMKEVQKLWEGVNLALSRGR